jgi:hypothetical protein
LIAIILVLTVLEHRLAFGIVHKLPAGRTAIFLIPLATLLIGIAAAVPPLSSGARWCRMGFIGTLFVLSLYYMSCLRLTYFEEWDYQADIKKAYDVAACYNHERNIQKIEAGWYYNSGMNFYRLVSGRETFGPFDSTIPYPTDRDLYVLEGTFDKAFIEANGLKVVFHGASSSLVIAVRPELADAPGGACYAWPLP